MSKKIKVIPIILFIAINIFVIVAMNFCAYSTHLHPTYHPEFSYFGMMFPIFLVADIIFIPFWLVVKWKYTSIPIIGLLLCAHSVRTYFPINYIGDAPEDCIKLISYNVMNFGGPPMTSVDFENNPIVEFLMDEDADIVCLQEGVVVGLNELETLLKTVYPYIESGPTDGCHTNVCMSKYPIIDVQNIAYESKTNRSYAYTILVENDTVLVVNNHFESYQLQAEDRQKYKDIILNPEGDSTKVNYNSLINKLTQKNKIRGLQADRVAEYIDSVPCKYKIACGDFNDPSLSYTHYRMTRNLNDAFTDSGFGPGISFNRSGMYFRIDNILVNDNIESYQTKVDNSICESDHYPIISHLILKEK